MLPDHHSLVRHIEATGVVDPLVLSAMSRIERHRFVPEEPLHVAYADHPLPIGSGQTISQPSLVALMTQLLHLKGGERVLEIGSGCGYQAAILACIASEVVAIEILPDLAERARRTLAELGRSNVRVEAGDGWFGTLDRKPFSGIILSCGAPIAPPSLLQQLVEGGSLVGPIGRDSGHCDLQRITRCGDDFRSETILTVRFVPMVGEALKHGSSRGF